MKNNWLIKLSILLVLGLLFFSNCSKTNIHPDDEDAEQVKRGRLKFSKSVSALRIGKNPIYRDVSHHIFVQEKEWFPPGDPDLANRISGCDTSPNPNIEILRCAGDATENYQTSYILRMKDDQPEVQRLDEGGGSVWINSDGCWLLFRKFFLNVVTGEKIAVKGMPFADNPIGSAPVTFVKGISPDMKTVVALLDSVTQNDGKKEFLILRIIDIEKGDFEDRKVDFAENPWLNDHENPFNNIQPPPAAAKKMVWEKGKDGKDKLIIPKLLEKIAKK